MLIYEKDNKLNINFENSVNESPDLQIGKSGDKTEVLIDGGSNPTIPVPVLPEDVGKAIVVNEDGGYALANAGSGGNSVLSVNNSLNEQTHQYELDKTYNEIVSAIENNQIVITKTNASTGSNTYNFIGFVCYYYQDGSDYTIATLGINTQGEYVTGYFVSDNPNGVLHE